MQVLVLSSNLNGGVGGTGHPQGKEENESGFVIASKSLGHPPKSMSPIQSVTEIPMEIINARIPQNRNLFSESQIRGLEMRFVVSGCLLVLVTIGLYIYVEILPHRPANVPPGAVPASINWGYVWDYCWINEGNNDVHCQIFNNGGKTLYDEIFLPYKGVSPKSSGDLKIRHDQKGGGVEWIYLENGTVLVPTSGYSKIKKELDREFANSAH